MCDSGYCTYVLGKWVREKKSDADLVDEIYLTFYSRLPNDAERKASVQHLARAVARSPDRATTERRQAAEDLAWTLMNTLEFVFKR